MGYQQALAIMWPHDDVTAVLYFSDGSTLGPQPPHCRAAPG